MQHQSVSAYIGQSQASLYLGKRTLLSAWFQCSKCMLRASNANKFSLIRGVCDRRSQRLHQALPVLNVEQQHEWVEHQDLRGGLSVTLGSMNVGSLSNKEHQLLDLNSDILTLQEVALPSSRWTSMTRSIKEMGGTVAWGALRQEDRRRRGRGWGIRLGTGLAVIAFQPWLIHSLEGTWPVTPQAQKVQHRLLSSVATNGPHQLVVHTIYLDAQRQDNLDMDVYDVLCQRIARIPRACHVLSGDWQQPSAHTPLGVALAGASWHNHARFQGPGHHTNLPPRGECRVLDDVWFSPNLLAAFTGSATVWEAGWSTHALLTLSFHFNDEAVEGVVLKLPPTHAEVQTALEAADNSVWDAPFLDSEDVTELYDHWLAQLNEWLQLKDHTLGALHQMPKSDRCDAKAPLRPRRFWRRI